MYEAVDLDLEIPVALKVLRPEYAGQPSAEARFRREATTAARLRHPNIIYIRDVGEAEGTVFVAMDLLPLSLARRLEVLPRLPESEVVRIALEVAAALSIAHGDGIVHRDIKPDNVMLGANGEAIVADFGLAGAFTKETRGLELDAEGGKVMGTPHYFSPEQARGLDLDGRTDLYSLGVMCYRAATGTLPFEGDDWYSVARQHVEDTPVPPRMLVPELGEGFEAIVLRLMSKKPEQRFASATQLADALLTLPTAPASRAVGITPSSASITQVAFPYVHAAMEAGTRSWKSRAVLAGVALAVVGGIGFFAMPPLAGLRTSSVFEPEITPTTRVVLDSNTAPALDTTLTASVVPKPTIPTTKPATKPANAARPTSNSRVGHVSLSAPSEAKITVNRSEHSYGTWDGDLSIGRQHHFVARLDGAQPGCRSAQMEDSVTLSPGQKYSKDFELYPCAVLLLEVQTPRSDYELISKDFNFSRPINATYGVPTPIVLREGNYILRVRTEKCSDYVDDNLRVDRLTATAADTVKKTVRPNCTSPVTKR